ncbi:hypothetical protein L227DRAFT_614019 [Lentinus tigrinus ALCF2SS1-6]|uniref:WW domain-containing protein n=1 Tax=Lentinus tigrinus ALCF2SS1-6 TaxID=1328759 RepID=A0A5C2S119_9APHY|nr:hypothetical protein L227DRAFT_614019 [Lentinus tigrinus ALCF2SS1-6]
MSAILQSLVLAALAYSSAQRISGRYRAQESSEDSSDDDAPEVVESAPVRTPNANRHTRASRSTQARHPTTTRSSTPATPPPATPPSTTPPGSPPEHPHVTSRHARLGTPFYPGSYQREQASWSPSPASTNPPPRRSAAGRSVHWSQPVASSSQRAHSEMQYPTFEAEAEEVKFRPVPPVLGPSGVPFMAPAPPPPLPPAFVVPSGTSLMPESASMAGRTPRTSSPRTSSSSTRVGRLAAPRLSDPFGVHYRAFRGFAGQLDEAGDPIGTYWFQSKSEDTIGAPPDFSRVQNVRLGDVYIHKMPNRYQLWLWSLADGVHYWHPVREGYRRMDGRKLQVTKGMREPSWVL